MKKPLKKPVEPSQYCISGSQLCRVSDICCGSLSDSLADLLAKAKVDLLNRGYLPHELSEVLSLDNLFLHDEGSYDYQEYWICSTLPVRKYGSIYEKEMKEYNKKLIKYNEQNQCAEDAEKELYERLKTKYESKS